MSVTKTVSIPRGRGRPKLGDVRLECTVPQRVMEALIQHENETGIYRTRVAALALCQWASAISGKKITPYHSEHLIQ
jgi:hypothetical protein